MSKIISRKFVITTRKLGQHRASFVNLTPNKKHHAMAEAWLKEQARLRAAAAAVTNTSRLGFAPASLAARPAAAATIPFSLLPEPWVPTQHPIATKKVDWNGNGLFDAIGLNFQLEPGGTHVLYELQSDNTTYLERSRLIAPDGPSFWGVWQGLEEDTQRAFYDFELRLEALAA